jgi:hypothetical protein
LLLAGDLDNNGAIDFVVAGADKGQVFLADGKGEFQALDEKAPAGIMALVDFNGDGRLDLLTAGPDGRPTRYLNQGKRAYYWQEIKPRKTSQVSLQPDERINSFALGGEVEARSGTFVIKQMIDSPVVHLGLGERSQADVIRFLWPNGASQAEFGKEVNSIIPVEQRLKGSCPFLFSWDGEKIVFVTDFMWSTPLGMFISAQDKGGFLQTTDWVKIRSDQLKPRNGVYDLRVQANLWETHYFDHLSLLVVDHPPNTDIFADERFYLTPTKPEVFLTTPPRPVARAWDVEGKDVTTIVRAIDGNYLNQVKGGPYQGITRDHWVEIDLGEDAPKEGPLFLVANGFVHPTDSSINYALEQGTNDRPRPLVLEVPDGKGGWKIGQDKLGFPAGKNKTILIRLDGIEGKGVCRRFRLRTNMEIYWDCLSYAKGLDAGKCRQTKLSPRKAELRFKGILAMTQANSSSPELPHYDRVITRKQYWRDLTGYYTRYGDVRELLQKVDDRYVIANAGDEVAFQFDVPADPPSGWKRDFIWIGDGWVKDGDHNTRFCKTVLPLPYHGMKSYDKPPRRLEDDPVYRRFPKDWEMYHTRYVTPYVYELGLRPFPN